MLRCPKCGMKDPTILLKPKEFVQRTRKEDGFVYRTTKPKKAVCKHCETVDYLWHFQEKKYNRWKSVKRGRKPKTIDEKVDELMGVAQ